MTTMSREERTGPHLTKDNETSLNLSKHIASAMTTVGKRPRSSDDDTTVAASVSHQDASGSIMPQLENDPKIADRSATSNRTGMHRTLFAPISTGSATSTRTGMDRTLLIGALAVVGATGSLCALVGIGRNRAHFSDPLALIAASNSRFLSSPYGDITLMDENFASLVDPPDALTDTAVFFHVPKAGGSAMEYLYGSCYDLTLATEVGGNPDMVQGIDPSHLSVFTTNWGVDMVNVDSTTHDGLDRAEKLHLAESGLSDIIFTSYIHHAAKLFTPDYRGRVFTIMRHPVERAASEFFYLQYATWETTYAPETKDWTVQQYAASDHAEHDWVTKNLLGIPRQELTDEDLEKAKYILEEKVLIGLIDRMEESVDRFNKYFGWEEPPDKVPCAEDMLGHKSSAGSNSHAHPKIEPGSDDWKALATNNRYDIQLYDFAVALFEEQGILFEDSEDEES